MKGDLAGDVTRAQENIRVRGGGREREDDGRGEKGGKRDRSLQARKLAQWP